MHQSESLEDDATPEARCVLNPLYEAAVAQKFDFEKGYQNHHWTCIQAAPRIGEPRVDELGLKGFAVRPALEPSHAARLAERVKRADTSLGPQEVGPLEVESALSAVFSPENHETINRYFLTEFAVIYFGLAQYKAQDSEPGGPEASPSFLWHCDTGPSKFLNVLIYLNGEQEHDGATQFLDSQATRSFKKLGYVFCPIEQRLSDLSGLAAKHDLPHEPITVRPDPGQAIFFEAANVLHRGLNPTRGTRCTLHLVLIPWAEPWDQFLHKHPDLLARNQDFGFPKLN